MAPIDLSAWGASRVPRPSQRDRPLFRQDWRPPAVGGTRWGQWCPRLLRGGQILYFNKMLKYKI